MRLATFNTFWLGTPETRKIQRSPEDEAAIVKLVTRLDADLILFQEVVSLPYLEELLSRANPGRFRLRDDDGLWLTTGRMRSRVSHLQKIVLAHDPAVLELIELQRPFARRWPGPREPLVARFRERATGFEFLLVGVHLKSGGLRLPPDSLPSQKRKAECAALVDWLRDSSVENNSRPDAIVVLGDFNAAREHPSLSPLHQLLPDWKWPTATFKPDIEGEHWSSYGERSVIDQVLLSPTAATHLVQAPVIHAFDLDPDFDAPPDSKNTGYEDTRTRYFFRRKTDLWIQPDYDFPPLLAENLYRVSDHRPLVVTLV